MKYICLKCGRGLEIDEDISYCPFCGNAYQLAASAPQAMQIVIGSDSERTIQEKYWKRTREAMTSVLFRLSASLPHFSKARAEKAQEEKTPGQYKTRMLEPAELPELARCTSMPAFRAKLTGILADVKEELQIKCSLMEIGQDYINENRKSGMKHRAAMACGEWPVEEIEDEYSIDIDEEEAFIQDFCMEIAESMGNMSPDRLSPELDFDMDMLKWPGDDEDVQMMDKCFKLYPDYALLWREIEDSTQKLISALESNGLFALTLVRGEVREAFDPAQSAKDLQQLKDGDYDPLFGEAPGYFIRTYFDGLAKLMEFTNELPDHLEIMELTPEGRLAKARKWLDGVKLSALNRLIDRWSEVLTLELDRLYQARSEDMIEVCAAIERLGKALDEQREQR